MNQQKKLVLPKESVLYNLIDALDCDANYIFQDGLNIKSKEFKLTPHEQEHLKKYRSLNNDGKEIVDIILEREYQFLEYRKKIEDIKGSEK